MRLIFPIVEGHGDARALPILLRRLANADSIYDLRVLAPFRIPKGQITNTDELEKAIEFGARKLRQEDRNSGILVLLDADEDCPAQLAPRLLQRIAIARADVVSRVVVAKCEYEAWFLAAAHSLRGRRGVRDDATPPDDVESIRDAKGYLERHLMIPDARYSESIDQPAFTAVFDINEARTAPSFEKLIRDVRSLLA